MEFFRFMIEKTLELFRMDFTIYGFTFSFWDVFMLVIIGSVVCGFFSHFFDR